MTTVTQWFGPDEKPYHEGKYESMFWDCFEIGPPTMNARWKDGCWRWESGNACFYQRRKWRGLAEKPQESE